MAGRFPLPAIISAFLIVLNLMAWVVMLGGAASLQKDADTIAPLLNLVNSQPGNALAYGDLFPVSTTGNFISYQWFKAVFQVLTLLFALGVIAIGQVQRFRLALVGLFATLAVLLSDSSNTFYYLFLQTKDNPQVTKRIRREVESYWSGCLMCASLNYLLIITLGTGVDTTHTANHHPAATTAGMKEAHNGATAV